MEFHPRIDTITKKINSNKIILGSFPTWSITVCENINEELVKEKAVVRKINGDQLFFYGSSINRFWHWYKQYVDQNIIISDTSTISTSLSNKNIGITDMILSCHRYGKSSLDKHLTKRVYNYLFIDSSRKNETIKILCTSKGVMNEMLLSNMFFKKHPTLILNKLSSLEIQEKYLNKLNGNFFSVKNPFFQRLESKEGLVIECFALPSPGSPYRRLRDFGFNEGDNEQFLMKYLECVFTWLIS